MAVLQTITTSSAKFRWHPQTTFDGGIAAPTFKFGLDQAIPRLETMTEEIELRDSGETTRVGMAYGTRRTTFDPSIRTDAAVVARAVVPCDKKADQIGHQTANIHVREEGNPPILHIRDQNQGN